MEKITYKKITGKTHNIVSTGQLWLADDHLLCIEESLAGQSYHRVFFKDIEAIILSHTGYHIFYLAFFIFCDLIAVLILSKNNTFSHTSGIIISAVILGIITAGAVINLMRGKISRLLVQTKNGPFKLPVRVRLAKARRIVQNLHPEIINAQK
jgi:hypothetical protein